MSILLNRKINYYFIISFLFNSVVIRQLDYEFEKNIGFTIYFVLCFSNQSINCKEYMFLCKKI